MKGDTEMGYTIKNIKNNYRTSIYILHNFQPSVKTYYDYHFFAIHIVCESQIKKVKFGFGLCYGFLE